MYPDSSLIACRQKKVKSQFILARKQNAGFEFSLGWELANNRTLSFEKQELLGQFSSTVEQKL
jgi:hypothetical protein